MPPLQLSVVTPDGLAFEGAVERAVLPGKEGYFGVLPGHEPFLSALQEGRLTLHTGEGGERSAFVARGYADVHENTVTVMVGRCEFAEDIDADRAELQRKRALAGLEKLKQQSDGEDQREYEQYREEYSRAVTRLTVAKKN